MIGWFKIKLTQLIINKGNRIGAVVRVLHSTSISSLYSFEQQTLNLQSSLEKLSLSSFRAHPGLFYPIIIYVG